jgi:hypothetical protein
MCAEKKLLAKVLQKNLIEIEKISQIMDENSLFIFFLLFIL